MNISHYYKFKFKFKNALRTAWLDDKHPWKHQTTYMVKLNLLIPPRKET
jgi:hypothetical protein